MNFQNILMIDDDEDDQEIFLAALKKVNINAQCSFANKPDRALHILSSKKIQPDLIFLDLNMPVMNGQQFLEVIKTDPVLKHIPVIMFSTTSHSGAIEVAKKTGAADFLTKPDKFEDWISVLQKILN